MALTSYTQQNAQQPANWVGVPTDKSRTMAMLGPWGGVVSPGWLRKEDQMIAETGRINADTAGTNMRNQLLQSIIGGGGGGLGLSIGGQGGSGGESDVLNSMLGDIGQREQGATNALTNRFGALGRSTTSTAFDQASQDLASAFTRERTAARAKASLTQSQQTNQLLSILMSALG